MPETLHIEAVSDSTYTPDHVLDILFEVLGARSLSAGGAVYLNVRRRVEMGRDTSDAVHPSDG